MRLLQPDQVASDAVERTFRHSPIGALVMSAFFTAPLIAIVWNWASFAHAASEVPWPAWLLLGPLALLAIAIEWLCLSASREVVHTAFLPSNWLVKTTRDGLYLQLRSYQNHHFALDAPTIAYFAFDELAGVRLVKETYDAATRNDRGRTTRKWIELAFANGDTRELEAWLAAEAKRPAPETRTLGLRARTRFGHHPAVVPRAGVLYVEALGGGMLAALAEHVRRAETTAVRLDADDQRPLEARIGELVARGDTFAAIALARAERELSLTDAHSLIERVRAGKSLDAHADATRRANAAATAHTPR
ncbi:MAG: hypothetical protein HZA52_13100 [Planctomycetes bacterium]|nr:hypothetical protein [Planctomycetota bacterium]